MTYFTNTKEVIHTLIHTHRGVSSWIFMSRQLHSVTSAELIHKYVRINTQTQRNQYTNT